MLRFSGCSVCILVVNRWPHTCNQEAQTTHNRSTDDFIVRRVNFPAWRAYYQQARFMGSGDLGAFWITAERRIISVQQVRLEFALHALLLCNRTRTTHPAASDDFASHHHGETVTSLLKINKYGWLKFFTDFYLTLCFNLSFISLLTCILT